MRYLTLDEIKCAEIEILKRVVDYLAQKGISYTITAGTLLGAVRHKGFIPWDDDIDLMIERNEYLRLIESLKHDSIENHAARIKAIGYEMGNADIPFLKFVDTSIVTEMSNGESQYIWIDIFPADAIPDKNKRVYYRITKILYTMYWFKRAQERPDLTGSALTQYDTFFARCYHKAIELMVMPLSMSFITSHFIKHVSRYHTHHTRCLSNNIWGVFDKEEFRRELMEDFTILRFEDMEVAAMKGYDEWLRIRYGDYMIIPSESERSNHSFRAYYVND